MKIISSTTKQRVARFAIVFAILGIATLAFAVPANQMLRVEHNQTFTGKCCFTWGEAVSVTEPTAVVPVVVTWSTDIRTSYTFNAFTAGISVNGHPCQSFGSGLIRPTPNSPYFVPRAFQWIVQPSDGLIKENNTFTLCGGGTADADSITLGFNTLAVTISK